MSINNKSISDKKSTGGRFNQSTGGRLQIDARVPSSSGRFGPIPQTSGGRFGPSSSQIAGPNHSQFGRFGPHPSQPASSGRFGPKPTAQTFSPVTKLDISNIGKVGGAVQTITLEKAVLAQTVAQAPTVTTTGTGKKVKLDIRQICLDAQEEKTKASSFRSNSGRFGPKVTQTQVSNVSNVERIGNLPVQTIVIQDKQEVYVPTLVDFKPLRESNDDAERLRAKEVILAKAKAEEEADLEESLSAIKYNSATVRRTTSNDPTSVTEEIIMPPERVRDLLLVFAQSGDRNGVIDPGTQLKTFYAKHNGVQDALKVYCGGGDKVKIRVFIESHCKGLMTFDGKVRVSKCC